MKNVDFLISIIIPYFNTYEYTEKLLNTLIPQLNDDIEVFIIDDGCNDTRLDKLVSDYPYIYVWHTPNNSGGASRPRNIGLDSAKGKYILFIDSDDLVSEDYIESIREAIKEDWDYCLFSWESQKMKVIIKDEPPKWNCCIWNCCYKREIIGDTRFDENLRIAEDYVFNKKVRRGKKYVIPKILYYYNIRSGSIMRGGK